MKAIILCGGTGSRLWPITLSLPKQLIPIANKPILFYILDSLLELEINEIGIVVNDGEKIFEDYIELYDKRKDINITYINQSNPVGLANAVYMTKEFIGKEKFITILGDNMYDINLKSYIKKFEEIKSNCMILLKEVDNPCEFGIADIYEGKLKDVLEKPKIPPTNLAITGIYIFDNTIFDACQNIKPSFRGEYEITDAIKWLIDNGYNVNYEILRGRWKDIGRPRDVLDENLYRLSKIEENILGKTENTVVSGNVILGLGSRIINSIVRGPITIGRDVIIKNSYIGPYTSINNKSIINNCEIENSLILEECIISDVNSIIDSSIIEKGSIIKKNSNDRNANSFLLGKNSRLNLV